MALDAEKRSGQGKKDLGAKVDRNPMRVEKRFGQGKKDLGAKEHKHAGAQPAVHAGGKESNEDKSAQNGTCDSFAHMPAIHGRRSARRLCRDFGDIAWQYTLHNKNPWNCCNSKGFILVGMTGFEPAAFASRTHRETAIFQWFEALVSQGVSQAEISPCIFRAADITEELSVCV